MKRKTIKKLWIVVVALVSFSMVLAMAGPGMLYRN